MNFYHGSRKLFQKGFLLAPQGDGYVSQDDVKDFEALVESRRPADKTPRSRSVFLVNDPDLIDAAGGYTDVIYQVKSKSTPEESDLAWYSDAFCELDTDQPDLDLVNNFVDRYWAGTPHSDESRRCPEFRVKWAEVLSVFEINADEGDLEIHKDLNLSP